jgi:hypothetical protein
MYNQKNHRFDSFYNHKFGFHITGPHQGAFQEVLRLKPKVVKTLDFSVDVMKNIKTAIPDVFLIGRLFVHPQDFGQLSGSTAEAARRKGIDMAERILREEVNQERHHLNGKPLINAWESLNEVFPEWSDDNTQKLYDEYQVAFAQKMQAAGFEPIAFNFGQGNGRGQQWLKLYPGTLELYKYLGFHEYDWPTLDRLHKIGLNGPSEPQNLVPGVGEGRGNDGMWRALRYRRVMNEGIRQKYGDKHTVIITECGMTQAVWGGTALDIGPWAHQLTVPANIPGGTVPSPISAEAYWQTLQWYNSEIMRDDYVMGACMFVTGASGKPEWDTFEHLGPITNRIYQFQRSVSVARLSNLVPNPTPSVLDPNYQPSTPPPIGIEAKPDSGGTIEIEIKPEPEAKPTPPPPPPEPKWIYRLEVGQGMGLLVGDIGVANQQITITKPDDRVERPMSGSKAEYGRGGFETYAQIPGTYRVQFLDQSFNLQLTGQFTRVTFEQMVGAESVRVNFTFRDDHDTYAVNEKVVTRIELTNITTNTLAFGIMGLLTDTGKFQTSWSEGSIAPGQTFRHEDGLSFDTPGRHKILLSICFARKDACISGKAETSWVRFEPGLDVIVQ